MEIFRTITYATVSILILIILPLGSVVLTPTLVAFSGVYIQEIPTASIFYTTVVPVVYGFKVPNWTRNDTLLPISGCTTGNWSEGTTCPTIFHLSQVQSRFSEYLFNGRPIIRRLLEMGATPQVSEIMFDCHKLERHFRDIYVDQGVMERYLLQLKACSLAGDTEYFRHISSYDYNISSVYIQMYMGFFNEVWLQVSGGRIDAGLWSNAQKILNTLNFFNYHIELNRWHAALSDCEAGRIPASLVTPALIGDTLQELFETLSAENNLLPVISGSNIGNYFRNELADCTFTNESFMVRILVPVMSKNHSYSLYSFRSAIFFDDIGGRYCQVTLSNDVYLFDNLERVAYDTTCSPTKFCHAPNAHTNGRINPCASALMNDDWLDVLEYCPLNCYALTKYHTRTLTYSDIVKQMRSSKFLVVGSILGDTVVIVTCPATPVRRWSPLKKHGITKGALEVTLPCGCILTVSRTNYTASECSKEVASDDRPELKLLVPFRWLRDPKNILLKSKTNLSGMPYVTITENDLITSWTSDPSPTIGDESRGVTFFLVFCIVITLGVCAVVGFLVRKLHSLGVNLFTGYVTKIPGNTSYQHIEQPLADM